MIIFKSCIFQCSKFATSEFFLFLLRYEERNLYAVSDKPPAMKTVQVQSTFCVQMIPQIKPALIIVTILFIL